MELMELLYFLILLIFIIISNYITLKIGNKFYKDKENVELFDIFHIVLPDFIEYSFIINYITIILATLSLFFLSNNSLTIEFITKFIVIMLIRSITILSTILPRHKECDVETDATSILFGGCYDKIFSAHTSFILLLTLLYFREHIINMPTLIGLNAANILLILSTRSHYTVDVLLAIFVTSTIYKINV